MLNLTRFCKLGVASAFFLPFLLPGLQNFNPRELVKNPELGWVDPEAFEGSRIQLLGGVIHADGGLTIADPVGRGTW